MDLQRPEQEFENPGDPQNRRDLLPLQVTLPGVLKESHHRAN